MADAVTAPLLKLDNVRTAYGAIQALRGVTLEVLDGEIVTLIGANGAGKSTTLRTISGLLKVQGGAIAFDGRDISEIPAHRIVEMGLAHCPEGRRVFPDMTVRENLELGAYLRRDQRGIAADFERGFALFPILKERAGQKAGTLSGGEQQMLAIARALMSRPRLLMLDEPSLGLAPALVQTIFRTITEINAEGTTILLVEQNAHLALQVAHRGYVLETGEIVLTGTGQELLGNEAVREAYLGG
ncbi:MAG TPA: ABC transporter ATP-binding protein [bacterium]|nr:ABC transporter ATP-binding protein [bacterium]